MPQAAGAAQLVMTQEEDLAYAEALASLSRQPTALANVSQLIVLRG